MTEIDLPSLQLIRLGKWTMLGRDDPNCCLVLRSRHLLYCNLIIPDLPVLSYLESLDMSFSFPRIVTIESIFVFDIEYIRFAESKLSLAP